MKSLIEKIFSKKNEFTYVFAEYQPAEVRSASSDEADPSNLWGKNSRDDEMQIDKMYQSL